MSSFSDSDASALKYRKRQVARGGLEQLTKLPEEAMQCHLLEEWLNGDLAFQERALWIIEEIFDQAAQNGMNGRRLFKPAHLSLLSLKHSHRLKLMIKAKQVDLEFVRACLWASLIPNQPLNTSERYDIASDQKGRTLTLGERRSLARKPSVRSIERLLLDPDPLVMKHLLQNPRLTESLVLKIVSARPQKPQVLLMIFEHSVWGVRREVQRSLCLNPFSPLSIRCALCPTLSQKGLQDLLREHQVPRPLKAAINKQLT